MPVSGEHALTGWRSKVADAVAVPGARYTPLEEDRVRALVGWAFLILSVVYIAQVVREMARDA